MEYNYNRREVYIPEKYFRKDRLIQLTQRENEIFSLLYLKKDKCATYSEICKALYGYNDISKYDKNSISTIISRMRKKGIDIVPLYGYGYKLKGGNK